MSNNTVTFTAFLKDMFSSPLSQLNAKSDATFGKINKEIDKISTGGAKAAHSINQIDEQLNKLKEARAISIDLKYIKQANKEIKELETQRNKLEGTSSGNGLFNLGSIGTGLMGAFGITAGIAGAVDLGKSIIHVRGEHEKLQAVLGNIMGDEELAKATISDIEDLAGNSPFKIADMTDAFVKLANKGIIPTMDEMKSMGDVASSAGKNYEELLEAVGNASMGNFRSLRQFGIKAKQEGDNIQFTFRGITTTVANTEDAIQKYVVGVGNMAGVTGSMAKVGATLEGSFTKLANSWDLFLIELGKSDGIFSGVISGLQKLIDKVRESLETTEEKKQKNDTDYETKLSDEIRSYLKAGLTEKQISDKMQENIQADNEIATAGIESALDNISPAMQASPVLKFLSTALGFGDEEDQAESDLAAYSSEQSKAQKILSDWKTSFPTMFDKISKESGINNDKPGAPTDLGAGIGSVSGGAGVKNVTITVQKMVGVETITTTNIMDSASDIGAAIDKALLTALNDANAVVG